MAISVLITGGSGMIGTRLTELLSQKGNRVSHLGRRHEAGKIRSYVWDVDKMQMDTAALDGVNAIVHLAGAGIADQRWSEERKREILDSRVNSTMLLRSTLRSRSHQVSAFVSASAIGYYGYFDDARSLSEDSPAGHDFLANVVKAWEAEVDTIANGSTRVVKLRTGIVLSPKGGALEAMARPIRWGVGAALGSGKQYISWIHIDDLCNIYIKALEDQSLHGCYNATTPHAVTNRELTKMIASVLKRPIVLPNVPPFALRLMVGEITESLIHGQNVSCAKLVKSGYRFQYTELRKALEDCLR